MSFFICLKRLIVWHEGLLFKLRQNRISGELITRIKDFGSCRKQRVVLNGQHSSLADVKAGVTQGSILGPLLFLIYINDLPNGLNSNAKLFADDTSLFSVVRNITDSANLLNSDLSKIKEWALQWKILIRTQQNKLKRSYSVAKPHREMTRVLCLIIV